MREIKYRAWDEIHKCFYNKPFFICGNNGLLFIYNDDNLSFEDFDAINPVIGLTVQQFTGLKDKDGKDIYEGDIVETTFSSKSLDKVVFAENGAFMFERCDTLIKTGCRVVGNILENPELLK